MLNSRLLIYAEEETLRTRKQHYLLLLLSHFWNRWKREYVVELREHHRAKKETFNGRPIQLEDIIL